MVMSALTVRANMRMMFDEGSANRAQAKYMARIAQMEQGASNATGRANQHLLNNHKMLVSQLMAQNKAADKQLSDSKEQIAKKISAASRRALKAIKPPSALAKDDPDKYKKEEARYKAAALKIKAINKDMLADAKKLGAVGLTGNKISTRQFLEQEAHIRKKIIALAEAEVKAQRHGSAERKLAQRELDRYLGAQKMINAEEHKHGETIKKNMAAIRMSQMLVNKGTSRNNVLLKEQMALLQRINQAYSSVAMQLTGAFTGALMASGIALMTFGFRLQSVISDFISFEKELMNAQSIYQKSFDILFDLSDDIINFSTQYGVTLQDASEGLYTLASAGLTASESQEVLTNTLKLAMAVQGDHDTIAKLTTQTLFGFGKEMSESARITDMFAHSINKSLIEYQDLASSVKFAMPFFVATNQEVEQLLGALQILSNRALEAGIAGRGLRQTLAEFAQHAEDNTAAFAKLGIELVNQEGMFKDLTVIAKEFHDAFPDINDNVDLMTTLLEDLNVRGATAFVHLVREADTFKDAVDDLQNSTGAATEMANVQQKSLSNQIQVIKNALMAPFLLSDEVGRTNETLNTFGNQLHEITQEFEDLFLIKMDDGTRALTNLGAELRDSVILLVRDLSGLLRDLLKGFAQMNKGSNSLRTTIHALLIPLRAVGLLFRVFGDGMLEAILMMKVMNGLLPISQAHTVAFTLATLSSKNATAASGIASDIKTKMLILENGQMALNARQQAILTTVQLGANVAMFAGITLLNKSSQAYQILGAALLVAAGGMMAFNIARAAGVEATFGMTKMTAAVAAGAGTMLTLGVATRSFMKPPKIETPSTPMADLGMRMYDMGGSLGGRHFPVMVEPGESIVSKTQNMLGGGSGITLNIQGDIVTNDADDFAERIAVALPEALRKVNDVGGI